MRGFQKVEKWKMQRKTDQKNETRNLIFVSYILLFKCFSCASVLPSVSYFLLLSLTFFLFLLCLSSIIFRFFFVCLAHVHLQFWLYWTNERTNGRTNKFKLVANEGPYIKPNISLSLAYYLQTGTHSWRTK